MGMGCYYRISACAKFLLAAGGLGLQNKCSRLSGHHVWRRGRHAWYLGDTVLSLQEGCQCDETCEECAGAGFLRAMLQGSDESACGAGESWRCEERCSGATATTAGYCAPAAEGCCAGCAGGGGGSACGGETASRE